MNRRFPWEPPIRASDLGTFGSASWDDLDRAAQDWVGLPGVVVPSIRVGLLWLLEELGLRRHKDHVLVPRFMGRCILNAINRAAMPTETITDSTRAAIIVHGMGFRQDMDRIRAECERRRLPYVEDSPAGPHVNEALDPASLGRFVGFSKVLPSIKGAFFLSDNTSLVEKFRRRRMRSSPWSHLVGRGMRHVRRPARVAAYSPLADVLYELYPPAGGDTKYTRRNMLAALRMAPTLAKGAQARMAEAADALGDSVIVPRELRVPYVAFMRGDVPAEPFAARGFEGGRYHVDVARNMLKPDYQPGRLIPLTPRIPRASFDGLLSDLTGSR